jgi:hypothetical protein
MLRLLVYFRTNNTDECWNLSAVFFYLTTPLPQVENQKLKGYILHSTDVAWVRAQGRQQMLKS